MAHHLKRRRSGHVQPEAPVISLNQSGRLRTKHVLAIAGWSASTLYNRIAAKNFPPPFKDGKSNFWTTEQVRVALGL